MSLRHSCQVCGQPCSSTTGTPEPAVTTCSATRVRRSVRCSKAKSTGVNKNFPTRYAGRQTLDHRPFVLVAAVALHRAHELVALRAEPHDERARDQHRGVDAEADADGEGEREVVQRRAAEDEHR